MIRFACASCQKILSAPDEKAGMRFACPACKGPVVVPAASTAPQPARPSSQGIQSIQPARLSSQGFAPAPSEPAAAQDPPRPFALRFLSECLAISVATFRQTLKPFTLIFEVSRRNRLRRKANEAHSALGQRLYETQLGDKKLRARIQALGERIHSIQDVRGDARPATAERKALILQLAEPAIASETAPDAVAGEHERARATREKFRSQEASLAGAFGGLMPPNGVAWRRVTCGYALSALVAFGAYSLYLVATQGSRDRAAQEVAKSDEDKKRKEEDVEWAKERNPEQIVEKCGPSVALIRFKQGKREGGGTGFMIRPGVIATNAHVIDSVMPEELKVYFPSVKDLAKTPFPARVIHFDRKRDLAFLAVEPKVPPLRLADNFEFRSGKAITIIGCPGVGEMQLENAVSVGVLSTKTDVEKMPFYQLGASVNPGNSGGPVFDNRGQIIGVVTLKASQESIAFCIPWQDFKDRLDALEKEDPHKTAAAAQAMHSLHVMVERVFLSSAIYSRIMSGYAIAMRDATSRGRPVDEGIAQVRPFMDALLRKFTPYLVDAKYHAIGVKLLNDPNLPEDVRRKFGDLWKTYEELKQNVDKPGGTPGAYATKTQQLETRFKNNITALAEALGFEARKVDDDDDFRP